MIKHIGWLEQMLSGGHERCAAGFAYVMTKRLVDEFGPWIEKQCESSYATLSVALNMTEEYIRIGLNPSSETVLNIRKQVELLDWEEPEDEQEAMYSNGGLEALEVTLCLLRVLAGNERSAMAASSGERLLNFIDYKLNMVDGIGDTYNAPEFISEVQRQCELAKAILTSNVENVYAITQESVKNAPKLLRGVWGRP